jgi:hypothetical protein
MDLPHDLDWIADMWIYEQLAASTDLIGIVGHNSEIYRGLAPQEGIPVDSATGRKRPYCVYQNQTQGTTNNLQMSSRADITHGVVRYVVKVVGESANSKLLAQANQACLLALHQHDGLTNDGTGRVMECRQERTLQIDPEQVGDVIYETRGGVYLLLTQAA